MNCILIWDTKISPQELGLESLQVHLCAWDSSLYSTTWWLLPGIDGWAFDEAGFEQGKALSAPCAYSMACGECFSHFRKHQPSTYYGCTSSSKQSQRHNIPNISLCSPGWRCWITISLSPIEHVQARICDCLRVIVTVAFARNNFFPKKHPGT